MTSNKTLGSLWRIGAVLLIVMLSIASAMVPMLNNNDTALAAGETPMQDISSATGGWVDQDVGGYEVETPYRVFWESLPRNNQVTRHYKDYGVGGISGDFSYDFVASFYQSGGATSFVGVFVLSDAMDFTYDLLDDVTVDTIAVYFGDTDAVCTVYLGERDDAHSDGAQSQAMDDALYRYRALYFRLARSGTTVTLRMYDDPNRDADHLIYTLTHAWATAPSFRYLYMCNSWGNGAATSSKGYVSELYIGNQPTTFEGYNKSLPFKADSEDGFESFTYQQSLEGSSSESWNANLMGATVLTGTIDANNDDRCLGWDVAASAWTLYDASYAYVGSDLSGGLTRFGTSLRFNIAIPAGCTVLESYLYVNAHNPTATWEDDWYSTICAEIDSANPGQITDNTDYESHRGTDCGGPNNLSRTVHEKSWHPSAWTNDAWYESPDISDVIQEVVDTVGLTTHVMIFWDDHDLRGDAEEMWAGHNWGNAPPPQLIVKYKAGAVVNNASQKISSLWASEGDYSARFEADETDDIDYQAVMTPATCTFDGAIITADVRLDSLGAGEVTQFITVQDTTDYSMTVQVRENGAGLYEWGLREGLGNTDTWSGKYLSLDTNYSITLDVTCHKATFNPPRPRATLHVGGELIQSWYWAGAGHYDDWNINRIFLGCFEAYYAGTRYIDNVKFMDGGTYFPSIGRGGEDEGMLVYATRVADSHGYLYDGGWVAQTATFGTCRFDYFYSEDDGVTWTYFDTIGPEATIEYAESEIRYNSFNEKWYAFVQIEYNPTVDPDGAYMGRERVYELDNPKTDTWTQVASFIDDDCAIFPTRMVDSSDGSMIVSVCYNKGATGDPVDEYAVAAHFSITTYALERESEAIFRQEEIALRPEISEPMIWRDTEGNMNMLVRAEHSGVLSTAIYVKTSNGDTDGDWTVAYTNMGDEWEAKNALLRAFVFQGDAWFQFRFAEDDSDWNTWGTYVVRADRNNMNIKSEMWWPTLGEGGNGDIDARQRQFDGAFTMDFASDLHGQAWFMELDHFTGIPYVTTEPSYNIGVTRAGVRGYLDDGATCEYRFAYGPSEAYDNATTWTPSVNAGEFFHTTLTGLTPGVTYHYRAECRNSYGSAYGIDRVFTTALTVGVPSNLVGIAVSTSEISLSWEAGTGATESILRGKMGSYPTSVVDGFSVYTGEKSAYIMDNCTAGTTYYFALWGHDEPDYYSTTPAKTAVTTPAGFEAETGFPTHSGFTHSTTKVDTLPMHEAGDFAADTLGMQHGPFYGFTLCIFLGFFGVWLAVKTRSVIALILGALIVMAIGGAMDIYNPVFAILWLFLTIPIAYRGGMASDA